MKPVRLCAKAIMNSAPQDGIVLDCFGGSGSTLIAAEQVERRCFMIEMDPAYCDVIVDRWEKFTGKQAVKLAKF
jgi:DNA modification methylase